MVCQVGELSELSVLLAMTPDLVHHGIRHLLCEVDGLGHVEIVILNEIPLVTHMYIRSSAPNGQNEPGHSSPAPTTLSFTF